MYPYTRFLLLAVRLLSEAASEAASEGASEGAASEAPSEAGPAPLPPLN